MKLVVKGPVWNFVQHLLEMTIAMFVGMLVLGMPAKALFEALGWAAVNELTVPRTLVMATTMSIGMAAWMRVRGCGWPAIAEMSLAMYVPFLVMYPFYFAGLAGPAAVMVVGHVLMTPAMIVAMLLRKDEYTRTHHRRRTEEQEPVTVAARP
jgi:flagellar biosynthetic protein FliP